MTTSKSRLPVLSFSLTGPIMETTNMLCDTAKTNLTYVTSFMWLDSSYDTLTEPTNSTLLLNEQSFTKFATDPRRSVTTRPSIT